MDHKNPVSGTGDGVFILDIPKKHAIFFDCRFWQVRSGSKLHGRLTPSPASFHAPILQITTLWH